MSRSKKGPKWTEREDLVLHDLFGLVSNEGIAQVIGRTADAVESRARVFGLRTPTNRTIEGLRRAVERVQEAA